MSGVIIPPNVLDEFVRGYLVCALWSTNDQSEPNGGDPLDANYEISDIDPASVAGVTNDCKVFLEKNWEDMQEYAACIVTNPAQGTSWDYAGHDFWLNRNGHGSGFWDRYLYALGERLSEAARACKNQDLYVGDDDKLYLMGFETYADIATPVEQPK